MNGYDRIVTALQRKQPDRIPIMELYIHPKVVEGLCPGGDLLEMVEQMDLGEVKEKYGDRLHVSGNINCGYTLSEATVEEVVEEVKAAIRKGGPGGGYIMMSSNSLHSSVKPANYRAMVAACRRYGEYPLDMGSLR